MLPVAGIFLARFGRPHRVPLRADRALLGILARKFSRDAEELAHVAVFLSDLAVFVKPRRRLHIVKDEPDNRIPECALTGRAETIVTGDHALLALHKYRSVRLITLRDYKVVLPNDTACAAASITRSAR